MHLRGRVIVVACALLLIGGILYLTLTPEPPDHLLKVAIDATIEAVRLIPGMSGFTYDALETFANVAVFVPVGAVFAILIGASRWWGALGASLALSAVVELAQLLFLPARTASLADVLANGIGAGIGIALRAVFLARRRARAVSAGDDHEI